MKKVKYLNVSYPSMVKDNRLVIFGEGSHSIPHYKEEVIRALPILKGMGFNHLAMEMLPTSLQDKLDVFNKTGKGKEHLLMHFKRNWSHGMPSAGNAVAYQRIIVEARKLGMKVIPLDMPPEMFDSFEQNCDAEEMMKGSCKDRHAIRNEMWSRNLSKLLSQGHKVVSFMHHFHSVTRWKNDAGVRKLVREQGHKAVVINITGGVFCLSESECFSGQEVKAPYNKKRFYTEVEANPNKDYMKANYQVHLPEVRNPKAM